MTTWLREKCIMVLEKNCTMRSSRACRTHASRWGTRRGLQLWIEELSWLLVQRLPDPDSPDSFVSVNRRKRLIGQRSCISGYGCGLCKPPRCSAARRHPGVANSDGGGGASVRRRTRHESRADERSTLAPVDAAEAVSTVQYRGQAAA